MKRYDIWINESAQFGVLCNDRWDAYDYALSMNLGDCSKIKIIEV